MKHLLSILFLCCVSVVASAQIQQGYVKTRGRLGNNGLLIPGVRLQGATISLKNGGSYVSGMDGSFSLSIPSKTFYLINVQKQGYLLCDREVLGKNYQYSSNPFVVVMETSDNTTADRLAIEKKIRHTLQQQLQEQEERIESLLEEQKITQQRYTEMLQELYAAQGNNEQLISEMAERYSTLDFDQIDEFHRQIAIFIQNGELTQADSLLNTKGSMEKRSAELDRMDSLIQTEADEIARRQEAHAKNIALRTKVFHDYTTDCYNHYLICKTRHQNDSAAYWLQLRLAKDSTNIQWLLDVADFNYVYAIDYSKSEICYEKVIRMTLEENCDDNISLIRGYDGIASVNASLGNDSIAIYYFRKAQAVCESIYGIVCPIDNKIDEFKYITETLEKNNNLSACPYDILYQCFFRLIRLAEIYSRKGDATKQTQLITLSSGYLQVLQNCDNERIANRVQLVKFSLPSINRRWKFMIGKIEVEQGKYAEAIKHFSVTIENSVEEYGANHPIVANSYIVMAKALGFAGDMQKSLLFYEKALEIRKTVFGNNHPYVTDLEKKIQIIRESIDN